jgi:hypothetical protein
MNSAGGSRVNLPCPASVNADTKPRIDRETEPIAPNVSASEAAEVRRKGRGSRKNLEETQKGGNPGNEPGQRQGCSSLLSSFRFLRLPPFPTVAWSIEGFVGFVVQGSEVVGPRRARRTRMGHATASGRQLGFHRPAGAGKIETA